MKVLLTIVSLLVIGVLGQAPYPPSGWRPNGPTLELPQRRPLKQDYLPPSLDPRNPASAPDREYGPPEDDVSVQGLPTQEQLPIFQISPINGQQYVGPSFNKDLKNLDQSFKQSQNQQDIYRQFARQRQLEAQAANQANQQVPRQFVPRTTVRPTQAAYTTAKPDEFRTTQVDSTTEALTEANLNEGEVSGDAQPAKQKGKVTVEVSKQKIQEFPSELFLNTLAQLNLQSQVVPLQLGQIRAPVYFQPAQGVSQKQIAAGYDAATHFAALPSVLAQQQLLQSQARLVQSQPQAVQNPGYFVPQQNPAIVAPNDRQLVSQYQPLNPYQPGNQYETIQPQVQYPQVQAQAVVLQSQGNQIQPNYQQTEGQDDQTQPQFVYQQYQPQYQQPQPNQFQVNQAQATKPESQDDQTQPQFVYQQYQPQYQQPLQPNQFQVNQVQIKQSDVDDQTQPQFVYQQYQPQYQQPQPNQYQPQQPLIQLTFPSDYQQQILQQQVLQQQGFQPQDGSLQSGLDVNQQGNGVDQTEDKEDGEEDDRATATAVATAFGTRTQPRVYNAYGVPVPRVQASPDYQTTTEANAQDENAEDSPAVAEATAVAKGGRRKSAKLRSRRVRPVFTLDKSGHLVLAQEQ